MSKQKAGQNFSMNKKKFKMNSVKIIKFDLIKITT